MLLDIAKKYEDHVFAWIKGEYYDYKDIIVEYEKVKKIVSDSCIGEKTVVLVNDGSFRSIVTFLVLIDEGFVVALVKDEDVFCEKKIALSACKYIIRFDDDQLVISSLDRKSIPVLMQNFMKNNLSGIIIFSSGTSGEPKAALHDTSKILKPHEGSREKRRKLILFLELDHIGGMNTFFGAYYGGSTLLVPRKKDVLEVCSLIEREKADVLPTTPSFLNMMYLCKAFDNHDLSSLKIISYGTEKMRLELLKRLSEKLPDVKFIQTYGLSELGIMKTVSKNDSSLQMKIGGTGFQYKIVNGELLIKSEYAMEGYLNANSPFDNEGWYNTHDIVRVNENEYIEIIGRNSDIVNINGLKCNLLEIEDVILNNFEEIEDCLLFVEKHPILGSLIGIKIKCFNNVEEHSFKKMFFLKCKKLLPQYMIPVKVIFTDNGLNSYRWKKERNKIY